ncbi:unnamed protein product [Cuscuta campestris]|uniref:Uncharacterized protein n=1 Tax=Cuscuta campestris TaxID=132261 RepID=A0A484N1G8_9ASTE|nr:unnamed protein product [Cuscuta campestris]
MAILGDIKVVTMVGIGVDIKVVTMVGIGVATEVAVMATATASPVPVEAAAMLVAVVARIVTECANGVARTRGRPPSLKPAPTKLHN